MSWWSRFLTWLGISNPAKVVGAPGSKSERQKLEDWLEAHDQQINTIHDDQAKRGPRETYRQIRKQDKFLNSLPASADFHIDVYEAPAPTEQEPRGTNFGYTVTFTVTEPNAKVYTLTIEPNVFADPVWVEVVSGIPV